MALLAVKWGNLVLLEAGVLVFFEVVMVSVRVSEGSEVVLTLTSGGSEVVLKLTSGGSEVVLTKTSGGSERSNDEIGGRPI